MICDLLKYSLSGESAFRLHIRALYILTRFLIYNAEGKLIPKINTENCM